MYVMGISLHRINIFLQDMNIGACRLLHNSLFIIDRLSQERDQPLVGREGSFNFLREIHGSTVRVNY